ncbi:hypothetical protein Poli38472_009393 [Pythium oligandrum]|uniref:Uncharacterized protein n=1 Tax=Pythium oligandrum TaxID=41045 RepID=A0A8K1CKD5_PYTOL|nr:hypothetical protein Poli38472_009393 [Pythium oligandrum]|eukprot:TMW65226.1 hypothetical protein Poli38472_009393 [Pythium oligandrum]
MSQSATGDMSCTWYANEVCQGPRSCADCLQMDGCAVNPSGHCVSMAEYDPTEDFRLPTVAHDLFNYYPAENTTYCSSNDAKCQECSRIITDSNGLYGFGYRTELSPYCYGKDGCVCIAACETIHWSENVISDLCPSANNASSGSQDGQNQSTLFAYRTTAGTIMMMVFASIGSLAFASILVQYWRQQRFIAAARQRRARFARLSLRLPAWTAMRQALIDAEQAETEPKTAKIGRLDNTVAIDVDEAGVVVEEGDGYRPMSPSEYEHHHHTHHTAPSPIDASAHSETR